MADRLLKMEESEEIAVARLCRVELLGSHQANTAHATSESNPGRAKAGSKPKL
jgi:hypothetical protein